MIYTLGHPVLFGSIVLALVAGWLVHADAQRLLARRLGSSNARWLVPARAGAARLVDPYGAVAALLGGLGWAPPLEWTPHRGGRRGPVVAVLLVGPLANAVLGVAALAAYWVIWPGSPVFPIVLLNFGFAPDNAGQTVLLTMGAINIGLAVLSFVPLPPLEGARLLFLFAPRTLGWQKAEYQLVERNFGLIALLVLLVLPLGPGRIPPLTYVMGLVTDPILGALASAFR